MATPLPTRWRLRTLALPLPGTDGPLRRPLVMGIVNVTPDSFSDGGRHADAGAAVDHGLRLVAEGADILDVGGESTRPFSAPVDAAEELRRTATVVDRLVREAGVPVSIDTSKAAVARRALDLGAEIINDVTGLEGDPGMLPLAVETGAGVCAMHMQGTPQTMQILPRYDDVVAEIHAWLVARRTALLTVGIDRERICLDPGIGFGKTHAHNVALVRHAGRFLDIGQPILVGHSRKGFLGKLVEEALGRKADEALRDGATAGIACHLAAAGVQVVRVHAVGLVRAALEAFAAAR
ncbi:MAG: dihydropteroate synthase [Planctomycetes bacterium]|nr:dihydropteroate synthase [Planctomycetota bacterium]